MINRILSQSAWLDLLQERHPGVAPEALEASLTAISSALVATLKVPGTAIALPGVGMFHVEQSAPRAGRNPRTGQPISIPAKLRVRFKPSAALLRSLNPPSPGSGAASPPAASPPATPAP